MKISGRFGVIPAAWLEQDAVGLDEIGVLACLATFADSQGCCFPSQGTIAARLKRSRPWVIKIIHRLVALGLVERIHRFREDGAQRACLYRLCYGPPESTAVSVESPRDDRESPHPDTPCPREDSEQDSFQQQSLSPGEGDASFCTSGLQKNRPLLNSSRTIVPCDWQPDPADRHWAAHAYPEADLKQFTEQFINACQAHGYRYQDHNRAWRSWLADWSQRRKPSRPATGTTSTGNAPTTASVSPLPSARLSSGERRHESVASSASCNPSLVQHNHAVAEATRRRLRERCQHPAVANAAVPGP